MKEQISKVTTIDKQLFLIKLFEIDFAIMISARQINSTLRRNFSFFKLNMIGGFELSV